MYKFIILRYCVNKGWSSKRLNDNVQVANTENSLFGAKMWGPMSQLMANLVLKHQICFYRAMHFSAKRGIAIACRLSVRLSVRPSVRPSVCDVGEL